MTELFFPTDGYRIRGAADDDMKFIMEHMGESILLSVDGDEAKLSDLWMKDILSITSIAIADGLMRSEMFILENSLKERTGILWMGISRDQFTCEDTGYLLGVSVKKELRGKGLGKGLMICAEEWCRNNGLLSMTLNVGSVNVRAKEFYEHRGFSERSSVMRKRLR